MQEKKKNARKKIKKSSSFFSFTDKLNKKSLPLNDNDII